jgi:hypothetical protein
MCQRGAMATSLYLCAVFLALAALPGGLASSCECARELTRPRARARVPLPAAATICRAAMARACIASPGDAAS